MTLVSVSVYAAAVCTTHSDSFSCTVSTSKWTSHDKHSPSLPSTAPYHNHQSVKPRNGGTRVTEQELYATPHTSTQPNQVAGDNHYYYNDGARTDSGAHSDSTVLYEDPTSPSYVVCVFMWHVTSLASFPGSFQRGLGMRLVSLLWHVSSCGVCFYCCTVLHGRADCCSFDSTPLLLYSLKCTPPLEVCLIQLGPLYQLR